MEAVLRCNDPGTRAYSKHHRTSRPRTTDGFSLLEMLVVLALVSVMVALIAPRLANTVRAIGISGDRAETIRQLERLPVLVRNDGRALVISADGPLQRDGIELPEGWRVTAVTPVTVAASGICGSASLKVDGAGMTEEWTLNAPDCRIDAQ